MIKSVESKLPQIKKEWWALKSKSLFMYNRFSDIATQAGVQREILDAARIQIDSFLKMQKPSAGWQPVRHAPPTPGRAAAGLGVGLRVGVAGVGAG
eukprot:3750347-Rhodomonas_salina.1